MAACVCVCVCENSGEVEGPSLLKMQRSTNEGRKRRKETRVKRSDWKRKFVGGEQMNHVVPPLSLMVGR